MPSDAPQDPCREWLGIDAADLGDHRRVLGVTPEERDPLAVLRAADARLARLRAVSAGPLESFRAGFVKRVEAARESVLAEIATGSGQPAGAAAAFRRPPAPSTLAPKRAAAAPPSPPPVVPPPVPIPAVPPPAAVAPQPADGPAAIKIRTTVYRKKTPVLGISLAMVGLSLVAGGLGYYVLVVKPRQAGHHDRMASEDGQDANEATDQGDPRRQAEPPQNAGLAVRGAEGRTASGPTTDATDQPPPRARPRRPRTASPDAAMAGTRAVAEAPTEQPPAPRPRSADRAVTKPKPTAATLDEMTPEESKSLDQSLADVLAALRNEDDDAVASLLEAAAGRARSPAGRRRLDGWQRLAASQRRFLDARASALDAVQPGAGYDVGERKVIIEKIDDEQCVFRAAGSPRTVPREKIPAGLVVAIVSAWAEDDPGIDIAIAASQMVREEPELRLARERLEKARAAGADVETLVPLLDDPLFAIAAEGR
jgi:hypothetical protein